MFLIAEQEEDYEAGGFSPVLDTPFPLTRFPPLVLPVLAQYLCWDTVFSPWFGALPKEAIFTYTSLLISARYFQGTLFRARSGCWVTEQLPFFHFRVAMSRVTVRGCILLHMRVVVIIAWELSLEHPSTNCRVGAQNIVGWNLRLALLICVFHTLNCLLTALPTALDLTATCEPKQKFGWPAFHWNLAWTAYCFAASSLDFALF